MTHLKKEQDLDRIGDIPYVPFLRFCYIDFFSWDESVFFG